MNQSYSITFRLSDGTETVVQCEEDQYILDAAQVSSIDLPYSCRAGACSACAGRVIEGEIDNSEQTFLDDAQMDEGFTLLCVAYPLSDLLIETEQEENL
jgi:ferredoxin